VDAQRIESRAEAGDIDVGDDVIGFEASQGFTARSHPDVSDGLGGLPLQRRGKSVALLVLIDSVQPAVSQLTEDEGMLASSRMARHMNKLMGSHTRGKVVHIAHLVKVVLRLLRHRVLQWLCGVCLKSDRRLPERLRTFYINEVLFRKVYRLSGREYRPAVYKGDVVLIRSEMNDEAPESFWSRLVTGEFKVIDVPGNHLSMLEEPNVAALADHLKTCIEKATPPYVGLTA